MSESRVGPYDRDEVRDLCRLIVSTSCADLADAVVRLEALIAEADELEWADLSAVWRAELAEVWPRYSAAAEFVDEASSMADR